MSAFDDAAAALYADENLSRTADYYAAGAGSPLAVRIIFSEPAAEDVFGSAAKVARDIKADILLCVVPKPARDDVLVIGGCRYEVAVVLPDDLNISATLLLKPQSKSGD